MRDVVFLFGAGASAGAGCILPEPPPLGAALFGELRRFFPRSWGGLPGTLNAEFEVSFESGMGVLAEKHGAAVAPLMRDMAIYFIQFRPVDNNCMYNRLLRGLSALRVLPRVVLSTLNYECVLEFAILQEGLGIAYFQDTDTGNIPVWKLHGSCNMFAENVQASPGVLFNGVVVEGGVRAWLDPSRVIEHCLSETGLGPVMCLYMEGKPTFTSPTDLKVLQTQWANAVKQALAVVCVGVRPHLPDAHIWEPLLASPATVLFIGGRDQFDESIVVRTAGPSAYVGARFSDGLPHVLTRVEELCN